MKVDSVLLSYSLFEAIAFCYFLDDKELVNTCCREYLKEQGIEYDENCSDSLCDFAEDHGLDPNDIREYVVHESSCFYDWKHRIVTDPVSDFKDEDGQIDLKKHGDELFDRILENIKEASKEVSLKSNHSPLNHVGMRDIAACIENEGAFDYTQCDFFWIEGEKEYVVEKLREYSEFDRSLAKKTA